MKVIKSLLAELVLPFILCWFFMTILVDIIVMPAVFKNISNLQEAGKIGMIVFGRFNCFEIFFAFFILLGVCSYYKKSKLMITISIYLVLLSLFYTFYMTPTIADAGIKLHQVSLTDPQYAMLKKEHSFYHILYSRLDMAKLLVLLAFAGFVSRYNLKKIHKECA